MKKAKPKISRAKSMRELVGYDIDDWVTPKEIPVTSNDSLEKITKPDPIQVSDLWPLGGKLSVEFRTASTRSFNAHDFKLFKHQ